MCSPASRPLNFLMAAIIWGGGFSPISALAVPTTTVGYPLTENHGNQLNLLSAVTRSQEANVNALEHKSELESPLVDEYADDWDEEDEEDEEDYEDETGDPNPLEGFVSFESNQYWTSSDDDDESHAELYLSSFSFLEMNFTPNLSLELEASYESGGDGDYFAISEHYLWVDTLVAFYSRDESAWGLGIGKIDPLYDVWDLSLGVFSTFQGDDLDLIGVVGLEVGWDFTDDSDGDHYLNIATFFQDTSPLGGSIIGDDERLSLADGGVGNTEEFNNYVVSLSGDDPFWGSDGEYSIGMVWQSPGLDDETGELSGFAGLHGSTEFGEDIEAYPFIELLVRDGADGEAKTATTVAVGTAWESEHWFVSASYSFRHTELDDSDADFDDYSIEISLGRVFNSGAYFDLGYQYLREDGDAEQGIILNFGFLIDFVFGPSGARMPGERADLERVRRRQRN